MSTATEQLARTMVKLDQAIKEAAQEHRWMEASELEDTRDRVQQTRSTLLRLGREVA